MELASLPQWVHPIVHSPTTYFHSSIMQDKSIWVASERQVRWWDEITGFIIIKYMHDHGIKGTHAKVENNELCMSCICNYCMYYITR